MPDPVIQFTLAQGLAGKTDPRTQPLGTLTTAQNVVWNQLGAVEKRPGNKSQGHAVGYPSTASLGYSAAAALPSTIPASPAGMLAFGSEQVTVSGNRVYTYSPLSARHTSKDEIPEAVGTRKSLAGASTSTQVYSADVCQTTDGFRVYAWIDSSSGVGNLFFRVYDTTSGANIYVASTSLNGVIGGSSNVTNYRLVACGAQVVVLFIGEGSPSILTGVSLTPNAFAAGGGGIGTITTIASNVTTTVTNQVLDACSAINGQSVFAAYQLAAGGVRVLQISSTTLSVMTSTTIGAATTVTAIAICSNSYLSYIGTVCVGIVLAGSSSFVLYGALESSIGTVLYDFVISATATIGTISLCPWVSGSPYNVVLIGGSGVGGSGPMQTFLASSSGAVANYGSTCQSTYLVPSSKPVVIGGRAYALCFYNSPTATQYTYFWCDLEIAEYTAAIVQGFRNVATLAPRISFPMVSLIGFTSGVVVSGSSAFVPMSAIEGGGVVARVGGRVVQQSRLWEAQINYSHPARALSGQVGKGCWIGTSYYDGVDVTEAVFPTYPEVITGNGSTATGGLLTALGVYQYMVLYEWTSATGEIVRSTCLCSGPNYGTGAGPQQALTVTLTGTQNTITIYIDPTIPFTAKADAENYARSPPVISIYRTVAGGSTFNYVASVALGATSFVDKASDASIATNPQLYFTPGFLGTVLDYVCPPSSNAMFTAQSRVWTLGDDLRTWWFSNAAVEGAQPQFNEGLTIVIPEDGVAGAALDDNVILFSRTSIFYTNGPGPNPTGGGTLYPNPARIQSDVGCTDPRSVVTMPDGILFLSPKGLVVLGRDLSVNYLSAPGDVLAAYPNVTSAVLFPERSEVRIALNNGTSGVVLVASYWNCPAYQYRWSWFVLYDAVASQASAVVSGAAYVAGSYRWISSAGNPYQEDNTGSTWLDGGTAAANWVTQWVECSWIEPNGATGWHRAKRATPVGTWYTSHDLYVGIATDYVESYAQPTGQLSHFLSADIDASQWEQVRVHIGNQKSQSIRVSVYDAPPSSPGDSIGTGRGFSFAGVGIQMMPKSGVGKLLGGGRSK